MAAKGFRSVLRHGLSTSRSVRSVISSVMRLRVACGMCRVCMKRLEIPDEGEKG
jgi:hypothetical protein